MFYVHKRYLKTSNCFFQSTFNVKSATICSSTIASVLQCSLKIVRMYSINFDSFLNRHFTCCFICSSYITFAPLRVFLLWFLFRFSIFTFAFNVFVSNIICNISEIPSKRIVCMCISSFFVAYLRYLPLLVVRLLQ